MHAVNNSILPRILILSSAEEPSTRLLNDNFVKKLNLELAQQCRIEWRNYHEIGLELQTNNVHAFLLSDRTPLKDFTAVYFKSYFRFQEQAAAILEYLLENNIKFVGEELKSYIPATKLTQLARLARANLPIPKTIYMSTEKYGPNFEILERELGLPFIFKAIDGSTGENNYLINSLEQMSKALRETVKTHFIAQAFIPNEGDLRILVVGKVPRLVIDRRRKNENTHLNNTSQGGTANLIDVKRFKPELMSMAVRATNIMDREVAGVDIMLEKGTNDPYILEVNASPQIASGAFQDEKIEIYKNYFRELVGERSP